MPELALMYCVGVIAALVIGICFGITQRSKYHGPSYLTLQKNLKKADLLWNELNLSIENISDPNIDWNLIEYKKARITSIFLTAGATALSWIGAGFLVLIWFSLKFLIHSREEKKLKSSEIAKRDLERSEILKILETIKN
jgi:hypothetical protein